MKGKTLLSGVLVFAVVGIGLAILWGEHQNKQVVDEQIAQNITDVRIVEVSQLHSEILRLIASGTETVANITPEIAAKELEKRGGEQVDADKGEISVKNLPFEIVRAIAKSPASIAGIQPQAATRELVSRYLSIDLTDSDDVDSSILLEALQHQGEQKAIEDWAKNEDAEAIEAFMKEEADRDPSSIANFAYGLKNLNKDHDAAVSYMDRYASHHESDAFDNPDTEKAHKILIDSIKNLH